MADVMIPRKRVLDYLKSDIAEQIKDEQAASEKYRDMAEMAERLGMADISGKLRGIATDEDRHHDILDAILRSLPGSSSQSETHYCYKCSQPFNPDNAEYCTVCGVLKCSNGGHCLCSLSPEARTAVENELTSLGMWEYHGGSRRKKRTR
jgi:hypothetical protein